MDHAHLDEIVGGLELVVHLFGVRFDRHGIDGCQGLTALAEEIVRRGDVLLAFLKDAIKAALVVLGFLLKLSEQVFHTAELSFRFVFAGLQDSLLPFQLRKAGVFQLDTRAGLLVQNSLQTCGFHIHSLIEFLFFSSAGHPRFGRHGCRSSD